MNFWILFSIITFSFSYQHIHKQCRLFCVLSYIFHDEQLSSKRKEASERSVINKMVVLTAILFQIRFNWKSLAWPIVPTLVNHSPFLLQPVPVRALGSPHVLISFSFLPAGLGLSYTPIQNSTLTSLLKLTLQFLQDSHQNTRLKQPSTNPPHNVEVPSSKAEYVYRVLDTVSGLKELSFIIITLDSLKCYIDNFTIQPRLS